MTNPFEDRAMPLGGPATDITPVTPSDSVALEHVALALYAETGGALSLVTLHGPDPTGAARRSFDPACGLSPGQCYWHDRKRHPRRGPSMKFVTDLCLTGHRSRGAGASAPSHPPPPTGPAASGSLESVIAQDGAYYRVHTFSGNGHSLSRAAG